jgi:hypothetical protein
LCCSCLALLPSARFGLVEERVDQGGEGRIVLEQEGVAGVGVEPRRRSGDSASLATPLLGVRSTWRPLLLRPCRSLRLVDLYQSDIILLAWWQGPSSDSALRKQPRQRRRVSRAAHGRRRGRATRVPGRAAQTAPGARRKSGGVIGGRSLSVPAPSTNPGVLLSASARAHQRQVVVANGDHVAPLFAAELSGKLNYRQERGANWLERRGDVP